MFELWTQQDSRGRTPGVGNIIARWLARFKKSPQEMATESLSDSMRAAVRELPRRFEKQNIRHAIIGGVAMVLHGHVRATRDVDFIVDAGRADDLHAMLLQAGFECLHRDVVFANYLLNNLRVDVLFTQGSYSERMLTTADSVALPSGNLWVVKPEGLVGLKLQALANNPGRPNDEADIRWLLLNRAHTMDMAAVRAYFKLFSREVMLDEILAIKR